MVTCMLIFQHVFPVHLQMSCIPFPCWFMWKIIKTPVDFLGLQLYREIVLLGQGNYFLMGEMTTKHLISCLVQASQILSTVTFAKSWVVQFGLPKCLIVGHLTLEIWRYKELGTS